MDFLTMTTEDRAKHFAGLDTAALTAAHTEVNTALTAAFSVAESDLTIAHADKTSTLMAALSQIEAVQTERATAAADAAKRFAAHKAQFNSEASINDGVESGPERDEDGNLIDAGTDEGDDTGDEGDGDDTSDEGDETDVDPEVEAAKGKNPFPPKDDEEDPKKKDAEALSAAARGNTRLPSGGSATRKAGRAAPRPARKSTPDVVITAAADVSGFAAGQTLTGMEQVTTAVLNRVKGFPKFNAKAAQQVVQSRGNEDPLLVPFGAASFGVPFSEPLVASADNAGNDYGTMRAAVKRHKEVLTASMDYDRYKGNKDALTAAGFCAPSEVSYSYLADYNVYGLLTTPEVSAPRGGLMTTTGPALASTFAADGSDFGWTLTEAQMEAGVLKTCETIVCPDFNDHRLDAVGYCWKIPILTEKAYPELVTDAMRLSSVLYAHKMNARFIGDQLALSTAVVAGGLGASFTDTLEALTILAVKERRKWNLGENAIMEVKLPLWVKEVFRADISRRQALTNQVANDAWIASEFSARNLAVEYLTDWAELGGANPVFPATFPVMVYPAGTFVKAVEDVINLSAVYDAASLVKNEYTGVFYEQAVMLFLAGYGSTKFTVPICTAGLVGAAVLDCNPLTLNNEGPDADAT